MKHTIYKVVVLNPSELEHVVVVRLVVAVVVAVEEVRSYISEVSTMMWQNQTFMITSPLLEVLAMPFFSRYLILFPYDEYAVRYIHVIHIVIQT